MQVRANVQICESYFRLCPSPSATQGKAVIMIDFYMAILFSREKITILGGLFFEAVRRSNLVCIFSQLSGLVFVACENRIAISGVSAPQRATSASNVFLGTLLDDFLRPDKSKTGFADFKQYGCANGLCLARW